MLAVSTAARLIDCLMTTHNAGDRQPRRPITCCVRVGVDCCRINAAYQVVVESQTYVGYSNAHVYPSIYSGLVLVTHGMVHVSVSLSVIQRIGILQRRLDRSRC